MIRSYVKQGEMDGETRAKTEDILKDSLNNGYQAEAADAAGCAAPEQQPLSERYAGRIAMIGHKDFPSDVGGVEVVVSELAPALVKRGWSVTVYNRGREKGHNRYSCEGVEVRRCLTSRRQGFNALFASVTATVRALFGHYDLIHYHALGPSVMILLARLFRIKTVATVHGLDWQRAKWDRFASAYLKLGERVIARHADAVIVLSRGEQDYFRRTYGRETALIGNAITPIEAADCEEITKQFGLVSRGYILFLARIVPEKGLHYLIRAFKRCQTGKKLVIAGEMPDDAYGREIRELAEGQPDILFTGFVRGRILRELYCNCALYVLPSEIEGMALSLLEAMSAGVRCLTSDIPENTDVLRDFGLTFRSGDEQSLCESISAALREGDEFPRAEEQKRYIRENYRIDAVTDRTEEIYQSVIRKAAAGKIPSDEKRGVCR